MANAPIVFLSSTAENLKFYRQAGRDAAAASKFLLERMEDFIARSAAWPATPRC